MALLPRLDTAVDTHQHGPRMDSAFLSELFWDAVLLEPEERKESDDDLRHLSTYCHDDYSFVKNRDLSPLEKVCKITINDIEPENSSEKSSQTDNKHPDVSSNALQVYTKAGASQRCQQIIQISSNASKTTPKSLPRIFTTPPESHASSRRHPFWPDSPHPMISPRPSATSATPKTSVVTIPSSFLSTVRKFCRSPLVSPGTAVVTAIPWSHDTPVIDMRVGINMFGNTKAVEASPRPESRDGRSRKRSDSLMVPSGGFGPVSDCKSPYFVQNPARHNQTMDALVHAKRGGRVIEL